MGDETRRDLSTNVSRMRSLTKRASMSDCKFVYGLCSY